MQTIQTKYSNGRVRAACWNGSCRIDADPALSSEANHRAAAEKLVAKLNANRNVSWGIVCSAPSVGDGWTFIIDYVPDIRPLNMSITVKFMPATNTGPAYMRVYSWLKPKGIKVHYSPKVADGCDIQGHALYAANIMLDEINRQCEETRAGIKYGISEYVMTYDGDRLFTVKAE